MDAAQRQTIIQAFEGGQRIARLDLTRQTEPTNEQERRARFAHHAGYASVMSEAGLPPWSTGQATHEYEGKRGMLGKIVAEAHDAACTVVAQLELMPESLRPNIRHEVELAAIRVLRYRDVPLMQAAAYATDIADDIVGEQASQPRRTTSQVA